MTEYGFNQSAREILETMMRIICGGLTVGLLIVLPALKILGLA
jgi:hypothetical protein